MPLYHRDENGLSSIRQKSFVNEKELQNLVERNLEAVFSCRFVATEFSTGKEHAGRIDTLALSEDNNPVIVEYKVVASSDLINQSLFYLSWLKDHRGDFEMAASKQLGKIEVDWSDVRVICFAPDYKKYDLYAVKMMGANIELWSYKYFENGAFYIEEIFGQYNGSADSPAQRTDGKNSVMVEAGKKAALTRAIEVYTVEEHLSNVSPSVKKLFLAIQNYILDIDESVREEPKKLYIAYKLNKNFVCIEVKKNVIALYLKIDLKTVKTMPPNARDVSNIGHWGTGDFEYTIRNESDFEASKEYIMLAYNNIGG